MAQGRLPKEGVISQHLDGKEAETAFRLLFRGREEVSSKTMAVRAERADPDRLALLYTDREGLEARVEYHAPASKNYLRKQISVGRVKGELGPEVDREEILSYPTAFWLLVICMVVMAIWIY